MHTLGIDPDSTDLAFASWDENGPRTAQVVHIIRRKNSTEPSSVLLARALQDAQPEKLFGAFDHIAIEGQQFDRRTKSPASIFKLAHVTGVVIPWCIEHFGTAPISIPTPSEWKGGVAKHAHQGRMYRSLGWGSTVIGSGNNRYARPTKVPANFKHISPGQWKHVGDALLLALWSQTNSV